MPFFIIKSPNRDSCAKKIKLTTVDNEEYTREGFTHDMQQTMPMFHKSNTNNIANRLNEIQCPEDSDPNMTNACPIDEIHYTSKMPEEKRYCDFK